MKKSNDNIESPTTLNRQIASPSTPADLNPIVYVNVDDLKHENELQVHVLLI